MTTKLAAFAGNAGAANPTQLNAVHDILRTRGVERRLIVNDRMQQISHALQPIINVCPEEIANS